MRAENSNLRPINDYQGEGKNPLDMLGSRVEQALKENSFGSPSVAFEHNSKDILKAIAGISGQPMPGMIQNTVV